MSHPKICPINLRWACLSSQVVCHSFFLALLGTVIGSHSTSNRWIGPRPGWLSGAAVTTRLRLCVWWCMAVRAYPVCTLLFANNSTSVPLHVLSLIGILSSPNHCQHHCVLSLAHGLQGLTVFLSINILDFAVKLFLRCSWMQFQWKWAFRWHNNSICSERWGSVQDVK